MPTFLHRDLTQEPAEVIAAGELSEYPALPRLIEPPEQPAVTEPVDEPLVSIEHPRIIMINAYAKAGWTNALEGGLLRAGALERLITAAEHLPPRIGFAVFDAWRPLTLQAELYAAAYADPTVAAGFVAPPSEDPQRPPPHLTGGTVDITLTWDGIALGLGTGYDDFTPAAHVGSLEAFAGPSRELRRLLYWTMRAAGFIVLDCEWWHFEYGTTRWAAITDSAPRYGPAAIALG